MLTTRTVTTAEVPFGAGQPTLRLTLGRDQAGVAETLELAIGWSEGAGLFRTEQRPTLAIPAVLIPNVIGALRELAE